jgi:phosphate-selective porin OprO/OprP
MNARFRRLPLTPFVIVLLVCSGPPSAVADDVSPGKTVIEELLDILRQDGMIDENQYRSLKGRAHQEEQERVDAAVERAVTAAALAIEKAAPADAAPTAEQAVPDDWNFHWDNGFRLDRNDGEFRLKFGGRIHNDWAYIHADDEIDDALDSNGTGTEIRRGRIVFQGVLWKNLEFKSQFEFASSGDGSVSLKDMYIGLRNLGPVGTVRVGQMKEPYSLEQQMSSNDYTFMEPSLTGAFGPARSVGVLAFNPVFDERVLWQVGVFERTNPSGFSFADGTDWRVTGRLVAVPLYEDDGERVVHLGLTYSHRFQDRDLMQRFRRRPQAHLAPRFANTGSTIPAENTDILLSELAIVWGQASFQGSYSHTFVDAAMGKDLNFWSAYAQASYFLTGEHRNYRLGGGRFVRMNPRAQFNPATGDWGAWEIAARFGYVDLNDAAIRGGELWSVTAGLNWYLYPNARVMLNYVHSRLRDRTVLGPPAILDVDGDSDIGEMRFQIDF